MTTSIDDLFTDPPANLLPRLEELIVRRAYTFCSGNQVHTARMLGITRNVLRTHLKRFGLIAADHAEPGVSLLPGSATPTSPAP